MSVADRLKQARQEKGCTMTETAVACGITPQAVQAYETAQRIPRDSVKIALAHFYGMTVEDLFF